MSNKTSDKNVGSIEKDIRNIKQYINLVLDKGYCDCNELNVISTGKYCDGSKNVAYSMQNILAEREQKDKRIQELEEQLNYRTNKFIEITNLYLNSIQKQVVIETLNKHKLAYEELSKMYNNTHYEDDEIRARDFYMIVTEDRIIQVLQELLGEEKNRNV